MSSKAKVDNADIVPKPRKGKQFVQRVHKEVEDCSKANIRFSNLPHTTISPGRARTPAGVLGCGRTRGLSYHSTPRHTGSKSVHTDSNEAVLHGMLR